MNNKLIIYEPEKVIPKVFFTILKKINPPSLCVCARVCGSGHVYAMMSVWRLPSHCLLEASSLIHHYVN